MEGRSLIHASTFGNVSTINLIKEAKAHVVEFNVSSFTGVFNICSALYEGRSDEVWEYFTNPDFSTTKAAQFHDIIKEARDLHRPMSCIGRPVAEQDGDYFEAGGFRFERQTLYGESLINISNLNDSNNTATIQGLTLDDFYKRLHRISTSNVLCEQQNVQTISHTPAVPTVPTDKGNLTDDLWKLYRNLGLRSAGAGHYHLLDLFDLYETNKEVSLEAVMRIDSGNLNRKEIERFDEDMLDYCAELVQQATEDNNPNLKLYEDFRNFVMAWLGSVDV